MRRAVLARRRSSARDVVPFERSRTLPALVGPAPTSPSEALDLAIEYAAAHRDHGFQRVLVKAAWRALLQEYPDVQRADVRDRLRGLDVLAAYVTTRPTKPPAPPF